MRLLLCYQEYVPEYDEITSKLVWEQDRFNYVSESEIATWYHHHHHHSGICFCFYFKYLVYIYIYNVYTVQYRRCCWAHTVTWSVLELRHQNHNVLKIICRKFVTSFCETTVKGMKNHMLTFSSLVCLYFVLCCFRLYKPNNALNNHVLKWRLKWK